MEKELTINGKLYRLVEEEKPALEIGKWYSSHGSNTILYLGENPLSSNLFKAVGFTCGNNTGVWLNDSGCNQWEHGDWQLADMKEVEKLLIKEAEKRGFMAGCSVVSANTGIAWNIGDEIGFELDSVGLKLDDTYVFSFGAGKWAEIIEEKKPLYINSYGTEFFEGDRYYFITKQDMVIRGNEHINKISSSTDCRCSSKFTEIMTERECHRYLDEHWNELNK